MLLQFSWTEKDLTFFSLFRFLTKLKIKDGHASRTIQKMQNRANAIQNQVQLDKIKAKLECTSEKALYKPPKKTHLVNSTVG